mgnify:CR=1 FL=1
MLSCAGAPTPIICKCALKMEHILKHLTLMINTNCQRYQQVLVCYRTYTSVAFFQSEMFNMCTVSNAHSDRTCMNRTLALYTHIGQKLVNPLHGLLNCEIGGLDCLVITT